MVMNVGRRPTVNEGGEAASVEVHILHDFQSDFYGEVRLGLFRIRQDFALCLCL